MKFRAILFGLSALLATSPLFAAAEAKAPPPAQTKSAVPADTGYWLTIKSGVRHNAKCRYYNHSNGRPCTKDEGRACKVCGG